MIEPATKLLRQLALPLTATFVLLLLTDILVFQAIYLKEHVPLSNLNVDWWQYLMFAGLAVATALGAERFSVRKVIPLAALFLGVWFVVNLISLWYFQVNLFFLRTALIVTATVIAVHLKKLWLIDYELTENLVRLATTGNLLEVNATDVRIESGLRLLETVLPLSEAVVFRIDGKGEWAPAGRSRSAAERTDSTDRNSAWRENVSLCERAFSERGTVMRTDPDGSARVAVPLIYEDLAVGVLFVSVLRDFERADKKLLEAFSEQLARNFQRLELRGKDLPNKFWWSFLSTKSAENRVGATTLIRNIIKEQSFSAVASSYLHEAHAIAYLDGTIAYLNRQMRRLAEVDARQIELLDLFSLLDHFRTEAFSEPHLAIRRVLQSGEKYRNELFFSERNRTLDLEISLVKVPSDDVSIHDTNVALKPACFLVTLRDISAVKENERLRSDMVKLMSHELRTPVTSIKGFAELLLMDESQSGENREFLTIIATESQRLSKMLSTFLSVSNLEQSDKREVSKAAVRLDSVVREVLGELSEPARRKKITLVERSYDNLPPIAADKGLIHRAIANLVDNAIRYSPERTSVVISTVLEANSLSVVVEDRGYGIARSEHEKIWQKFYRVARDGMEKEEESTGLGLALVKEVAEQHNGEVSVESEPGRGSRFALRLPRL